MITDRAIGKKCLMEIMQRYNNKKTDTTKDTSQTNLEPQKGAVNTSGKTANIQGANNSPTPDINEQHQENDNSLRNKINSVKFNTGNPKLGYGNGNGEKIDKSPDYANSIEDEMEIKHPELDEIENDINNQPVEPDKLEAELENKPSEYEKLRAELENRPSEYEKRLTGIEKRRAETEMQLESIKNSIEANIEEQFKYSS